MEFKKFSAGKFSYGNSNPDNRQQMRFNNESGETEEISNVNFDDESFYKHWRNKNSENYEYIEKVLLLLAICHTIIIENKNGKVNYNASSPDELALVNAARFFGVRYVDRDEENNLYVDFRKEKQKWKLLNLIEFNSTRKRMTVVVKDPKGVIRVMCKGADSILFPLLKKSKEGREIEDKTNAFLEDYAKEGLRTLLLVEKVMTQAEYDAWQAKYVEASMSVFGREEKIDKVAVELEKNFQLIGSTAIEDKLQDGVGDTIQFMKDAGIKVWVLTGDKVETAINIGYSCKLLNNDMNQFIINGETPRQVFEQITNSRKEQALTQFVQDAAVIVSGDALLKISADERLIDQFVELSDCVQVVLACRVSPKQKAEIVSFIKQSHPRATTLSIGDGANDVNMITAAHVGVGISGLEGQQAARSADYAIGQFKFLKNLLFTHGREAYRRNAFLVCYIFYKNIVFVLPQFWYGFTSAFGGQPLYEQWLYQLYNILFTAFPIMWYALFDEEHVKEELLRNPKHFKIGLKNLSFGKYRFWRWILYGTSQTLMLQIIGFRLLLRP
jgi:phospholipid-transporting ATPase